MLKPSESDPGRSHAGSIVAALSWAFAWLLTLGAVAGHDRALMSSWDKKSHWGDYLKQGTMFLTQPSFLYRREAAPNEPTACYPTWLAIMRYEADFSVGLLAASAGLIAVYAARRRSDRRAWRGPGAVACSVALLAMGGCALEKAAEWAQSSQGLRTIPPAPFFSAWPRYELRIGLTVLGAWTVQAWMGRWRIGKSWADRAGVAVGFGWLAALAYRLLAHWWIPFGPWSY